MADQEDWPKRAKDAKCMTQTKDIKATWTGPLSQWSKKNQERYHRWPGLHVRRKKERQLLCSPYKGGADPPSNHQEHLKEDSNILHFGLCACGLNDVAEKCLSLPRICCGCAAVWQHNLVIPCGVFWCLPSEKCSETFKKQFLFSPFFCHIICGTVW